MEFVSRVPHASAHAAAAGGGRGSRVTASKRNLQTVRRASLGSIVDEGGQRALRHDTFRSNGRADRPHGGDSVVVCVNRDFPGRRFPARVQTMNNLARRLHF